METDFQQTQVKKRECGPIVSTCIKREMDEEIDLDQWETDGGSPSSTTSQQNGGH